MFTLHLTNIPDAGTRSFSTADEATAAGKASGFQLTVTCAGEGVVAHGWFDRVVTA